MTGTHPRRPERRYDSAGIPFSGRAVTSTGFDDDDGTADHNLIELIRNHSEAEWMAALTQARLLVPIVAAPTETAASGELTVDKESEMAVVTLTAPDGVTALPVFTSVEALTRWNQRARPSPVTAARAAQAAISEGCDVMLLDLGSEHHTVMRTSMVWALAQQQPWVPADQDPAVQRAVQRALARYESVQSHTLEDAGDGVLRLRIGLRAGLDQRQLEELATGVGEQLATDGEMRARIDGLAFAFEHA